MMAGTLWSSALQWGRAPRSAETQIVIRATGTDIELQWGRAPRSAETALWAGPQAGSVVASMGPRSEERGNRLKPAGLGWR